MTGDENELDLKIRVTQDGFGRLHTDVHITYKGESYYSRYNYVLNDTPTTRANERAGFLRRAKLYNY